MYDALAEVYEWLVPDELVTPAGATAPFEPILQRLPAGAPVLDCACGTGQLAVGLALAGFDVTATDISGAMIDRTRELAREHGATLRAECCAWDDLPATLPSGAFELVLCVGNALAHARGRAGRRRALAAMAGVLRAGGSLAVTSRNWEMVRSAGSGLRVAERLVERGGRAGVVMYGWQLAERWDDEHALDIAVALPRDDGTVTTHGERLPFWPFTHAHLDEDLRAAGLEPRTTTYDPEVDRYLVTAAKP